MPTSKKRKNKDTKKTVSFRESFNSHANFQNKIVNNLPETKLDPYHKKVSDLVQTFAEPLLNLANTEEALRNSIDFCQYFVKGEKFPKTYTSDILAT
ncbi:hypothetical protein EON78_04040 [bacterium]|nr:MAG: hypothetical protein EON78_04040 [bacterium]